jgi:TonB family protein
MIATNPKDSATQTRPEFNRFESTGPRFLKTVVVFMLIANGVPAFFPKFDSTSPISQSQPAAKVDQGKAIDFGPYMADVQRRIKHTWSPPKAGQSRHIVVSFRISKDGHLAYLHLEKSSGASLADQAALKAVEFAAPFRKPPEGAPDPLCIEFSFDYNVFEDKDSKPAVQEPSPIPVLQERQTAR